MAYVPFHHAQMLRTLPAWSKQLHPDHAEWIMQHAQIDYLKSDGTEQDWYRQASEADRAAVKRAMAVRDASRDALRTALTALQGLTEFCTPLLQARLGIDEPVDQAQYVYQAATVKQPSPGLGIGKPQTPLDVGDLVPKGDPVPRSLLEAAMHNFEGVGDATVFCRVQRGVSDRLPPEGLTVAAFIAHCRALDLGQQYQDHLAGIYEGATARDVRAKTIQARKDELRVQVRIAACKGTLDNLASVALHGLCAQDPVPAYGKRPLHIWQIELSGIPIHEVLFMAPAENGQNDPVILYNPADSDPLIQFASLSLCYKHLTSRLIDGTYRKRFVSLAPQSQQAELSAHLMRALFSNPDEKDEKALAPRTSVHLANEEKLLPNQPWETLENQHLRRLKADARFIAVPTAQVDAQARQKRLLEWLDTGMTLLNVAAMFIPALTPVMLAIGGAQIMESTFEGISAWEDGDNAEALAQLKSVLINVVTTAAIGAGASVMKASGFVDGMRSIIKGGDEYLWNPSMTGYTSATSIPAHLAADSRGRFIQDGQHFVRMDGSLFEQVTVDGRPRLAHPSDPQAYQPDLIDSGDGAWRTRHEQPLAWSDSQLLSRLGTVSDGLEQTDLEAAMKCTGVDGDELRYSQTAAVPSPPLFADALARLGADRQTNEIIDAVRHGKPLAAYRNFALPSLTELPGWPDGHVIKAFNGPESFGDATRYGVTDAPVPFEVEINRSELEEGLLGKRVLDQLEETAIKALLPEGTAVADRAKALNTKLADHLQTQRQQVFQRLYDASQPELDNEGQTLASQFPGLPPRATTRIVANTSPQERLQLNNGRVPLRIAEEARALQARARLDRALLGMYRPDLATSDTRLLDEDFQARYLDADASQRLSLAAADRETAAKVIGQQPIRPGYRSPMRLADGRVGYRLSGRPLSRSTADRRLQELYPSLNARQRATLQRQLGQRGDIGAQIRALQFERDTLDTALREWESQGTEAQQSDRAELRNQFNGAWRRDLDGFDDGSDRTSRLTLQYHSAGELPSLPARFDHIVTLQIRSLGVRQIPATFFQSFPSLRILRLAQNPELDFDSLFEALRYAPQLEVLELGNNQIGDLSAVMIERLSGLNSLRRLSLRRNALTLTATDLQNLTRLPLQYLDLESNNITLDEDLAASFTNLTSIRDLRLTNNPLHEAPDLTGLVHLENLQLSGCDLLEWPRGLTELMNLAEPNLRQVGLSDNQISQIDELEQVLGSRYVAALGEAPHQRYWHFNDNPLDADSSSRLRRAGVEIHTDELSDDVAINWRSDAGEQQQQRWDALFAEDSYPHLQAVIEQAGRSAQAGSNPEAMAAQVWKLLEQIEHDQALREHLELVAQQFPITCGDAGADAFSALEIEAMVFRELANVDNHGPYLFNVFRRVYRREMVNTLAERIQGARQARRAALERLQPPAQPPALDPLDDISDETLLATGIDLIEIRLALRQALAPEAILDYPEPSQGMLYRQEAQISPAVEFNVEQTVMALDTAPRRQAWVAGQSSWQRYLTQQFASRFGTLDERWYDGQQYLDDCASDLGEANLSLPASLHESVLNELAPALPASPLDANGQLRRLPLTSQQYDQASRRLADGRERERQALFQSLTQQQDMNG